VAISLALSLTSPAFLPGLLTTSDKGALLLMGFRYGLLGGGFLEELGWTGFAVPRLRQRHGALPTALVAGLLWGAYHFSVLFWATRPSGALELGLILPLQQRGLRCASSSSNVVSTSTRASVCAADPHLEASQQVDADIRGVQYLPLPAGRKCTVVVPPHQLPQRRRVPVGSPCRGGVLFKHSIK
jgi:hypothetical protein